MFLSKLISQAREELYEYYKHLALPQENQLCILGGKLLQEILEKNKHHNLGEWDLRNMVIKYSLARLTNHLRLL